MNYAWDAIVNHVARKISEAAEITVTSADLVAPPKPELGDLAFGCFVLAKSQGKSPADIAVALTEKLNAHTKDHLIASVTAAGPYVNVTLKAGEVISRIVQDVERDKNSYGASEDGEKKKVMLEYANQNTHKEVHVGHARVFVLGASVAKLLQRNGWSVITAGYHGDIGAHVAKCLWLFVRQAASVIPQPVEKKKKGVEPAKPMNPDEWAQFVLTHLDAEMAKAMLEKIPADERTGKYLGKMYSESTKVLEENPEWKDEVSDVQRKLEAKDAGWDVIWQETRRWSMDEFAHIYEDLRMNIDKTYVESDMVAEGQAMVDELVKKGVAKESQGAMVVDLEAEKLGVFLVRKSDGTSLYSTKDLALAFRKIKDYPDLSRSLVMIDLRQSLYFKQLFQTLKMMGMKQDLQMVGFEFVTLKNGAMSSREGNIVTLQSFRDEVVAVAKTETATRHPDWPQGKIEHVSWCLAMAGIKYGMLKQDTEKIIVFDLEKALSFDGDTGPYIQYAATRLASILKKADWKPETGLKEGDLSLLKEQTERRLALQIAALPRDIRRAGAELKPSVIAQWCFGMAQRTNDFYRDVKVIDGEPELKAPRLRLIASALSTLIIGLDLLGITVPEEM